MSCTCTKPHPEAAVKFGSAKYQRRFPAKKVTGVDKQNIAPSQVDQTPQGRRLAHLLQCDEPEGHPVSLADLGSIVLITVSRPSIRHRPR